MVRGLLLDVRDPESATVSPSSGGHLVRAGLASASARGNDMHPEDLLGPDLLSEIVLLGSGTLIFVSLLLIVVTAVTRS